MRGLRPKIQKNITIKTTKLSLIEIEKKLIAHRIRNVTFIELNELHKFLIPYQIKYLRPILLLIVL